MTDVPPATEPKPKDDAPPKAELYALGCGCLLIVLVFGAAMFYGFTRV